MVTELFPLQLAFRGLSDEDPDEITVIDSPDDLMTTMRMTTMTRDGDDDADADDNASPIE